MKRSYYKEKSATAQGRHDLHSELLSEIKSKMDELINNAPEASKAKVAALFDEAYKELESGGNSTLFDFYADDEISIMDFVRNIQSILR